MIIVIFIVAVLMLIAGICLVENTDFENTGALFGILGAILTLVCIASTITLAVDVSKLKVIDQKIEMYQEENAKIEHQISEVVKQYQDYESGIFAEVAPESSITLVALYPELKSDTLVQKQIEVYLENNTTIWKLKEEKINESIMRWWLYFGGNKKTG